MKIKRLIRVAALSVSLCLSIGFSSGAMASESIQGPVSQQATPDSAQSVVSTEVLGTSAGEVKAEANIELSDGSTHGLSIQVADTAANSELAGSKAIVDSKFGQTTVTAESGTFSLVTLTEVATPKLAVKFNLSSGLPVMGTELGNGKTSLNDSNGVYLGTLDKPWALDANGNSLPTHFELQSNTLVQVVDTSGDVAFPVTSDPSWSYGLDISYRYSLLQSTYSASYVTSRLKGCFNCYFPVYGAPPTYPYINQTMPLRIRDLWNSPTIHAQVKVTDTYNYGWVFTATSDHIDDAGSTIGFSWYRDATLHLHLQIDANIVNPNPMTKALNGAFGQFVCSVAWLVPYCNAAYIFKATDTWIVFFNAATK